MGHEQKRHISAITAAVLFAWAVSMLIVLSNSFITFTGVQNVRYSDNMIYGVNIRNTRNEIFAMNADTGAGQFLRIHQIGMDGVTSFPALELSDDGTIYLVREHYRDGNVDAMELVRWNLAKNRIETVQKIPDTKEKNLTGFEVKDDGWYFLYYEEDAQGNSSEVAYTLTTDGQYYKLNSTNDINWDRGISGVSISSLPFKGVRQRTGTIVAHIVIVMLAVLAAELLFWICSIWWRSGQRKHRSLIRMAVFTTAAFVIFMTAFNRLMRTVVFNYVLNHKIYSCEAEAEILSKTMDQTLLDNLTDGSQAVDTLEMQHILGNHWSLFTGVIVHRGNKLAVEGDLFHRGRMETVLTAGSLKDLVDKALITGEKISTVYAARRGVNALVLQPIKTESGTEAVICVRAPMRQSLYDAYMIRKHIIRICYALFAVILMITVAQVLWCLAPLRKLRWAMDELAAGNLKARAPVRGHNELAYAAIEFNRLADQLEEKQGGADLYRRFYEAFLPMNFLRRITGEHFPPSFKAGSSTDAEAIFLSLRIPDSISGGAPGCETASVETESSETVGCEAAECEASGDNTSECKASGCKTEGVSTLLSALVQIVEENRGSVLEFRDDGLTAVFTDALKDALLCALQLQRKTQEKTGKNAFMGMTAGKAEVFVAGGEKRREICVKTPEETDILLELSELLSNAMIVSMKPAAILNAERNGFHFRGLGRISLEAYSSSSELYALMDAELPEVRSKRERTLIDFEKGVNAYASGDYFTARRQMICCLLADPDDRTARSYCLNCERKEPPAICEAAR